VVFQLASLTDALWYMFGEVIRMTLLRHRRLVGAVGEAQLQMMRRCAAVRFAPDGAAIGEPVTGIRA